MLLLLFSGSHRSCFRLSADIDMKKDIETLIAEERADIILKYATVSLCFQHTQQSQSLLFGPDGSRSFLKHLIRFKPEQSVFESVWHMNHIQLKLYWYLS